MFENPNDTNTFMQKNPFEVGPKNLAPKFNFDLWFFIPFYNFMAYARESSKKFELNLLEKDLNFNSKDSIL